MKRLLLKLKKLHAPNCHFNVHIQTGPCFNNLERRVESVSRIVIFGLIWVTIANRFAMCYESAMKHLEFGPISFEPVI